MPERNPTKTPMLIAGTNLESGTPNTGQIPYTLGGSRTYTKYSGTAGGDVNIWVGGGRLDSIFVIPSADAGLSGRALLFYDAAAAVSGGPIFLSGHKVVGGVQVPTGSTPVLSGTPNIGGVVSVGVVFTSGLCHTGGSGGFGFSCSFTPVISG